VEQEWEYLVRRSLKSVAVLASAATSLALVAVANAGPASAAPASSGLLICDNANYGGPCSWFGSEVWISDLGKSGTGLQDKISSIQNYTGKTMCMWVDNNYRGIEGVFPSGQQWSDLTYPYHDSISSMKPC